MAQLSEPQNANHEVPSKGPQSLGQFTAVGVHLPVDRDAAWPGFRDPALVRAVFLGGHVRRAGTPSARFLLADESLLDLVGIAGEGIIGLEHREPTLVIPAASSCCPNEPASA